jgi:hypothetical protein
MEKLSALGLRVDEQEELKIIPRVIENESQVLATKCREFLNTIGLLEAKLEKTETLIEKLSTQSEKTTIVGLAAGIITATKSSI